MAGIPTPSPSHLPDFWEPSYSKMMLGNLASGIFTGGIGPVIGGTLGGIGLHQMQKASPAVQEIIGKHPVSGLVFGSILGQLLARTQMHGHSNRYLSPEGEGELLSESGPSPMPILKKKREQAVEPETEPTEELQKESSMNTVEELFKVATQAMEEKVFIPTVLTKLAERGYRAETEEELVELLKHANIVRQGIASGEMSPVPIRELNEEGQITKAAAEKVSGDFLAFAPDVQIDFKSVEPIVKEAATVLAWGFLQSVKQQSEAKA